ncbi:MAG: hypothetical protein N3A02_00545 [Rectinema sp.]|nr:hypothetical protein [Rectinema sp.]
MSRTTSALALSVSLALVTLAATGCGDRQPPPPSPAAPVVKVEDLPDWVRDPTMGGKYPLAAAGSSQWMKAGFAFTRDKALHNARTELGRVVSTKIQAVFKDWTREGGEITSQEDRTMAMTMAENISRSITNQEIQGTPQRELYHDKNTNTLFVWVDVDPEATKRIADAIAAKTRGEMEKRAHFAAKVEAEKAFADLDRLIDKELGVSGASGK